MPINPHNFNSSAELSVLYAGRKACSPGHRCGYFVRDHYLLHYIVSGSGEYHINGRHYRLSKGDGFLICPSASTYYKASEDDPWEYGWVGFSGPGAKMMLESAHLSQEHPVFHYEKDAFVETCLTNIQKATGTSEGIEYEALGYFYLLISRLIEQYLLKHRGRFDGAFQNVEKAIKYIQCNYWKSLSVGEVAKYIGIDRTQLFRLFKLSTDFSPQQYLINYRISKACELIANTDLNFEEIAHSVGFEYPSYFFRLFKKQAGQTPTEYRVSVRERGTA